MAWAEGFVFLDSRCLPYLNLFKFNLLIFHFKGLHSL